MDYSFRGDPNAIVEILATATPEHRAMQTARGWDDNTLANEIAKTRHENEEKKWKERVMRMSDEELEQEDDVIRAKVEADGLSKYRAMWFLGNVAEQKQATPFIIEKLKWSKGRLAFTRHEREFRAEIKRYSEGLPRMSNEVFLTEINAVAEEIAKHSKELMSCPFPFNAEPRVMEKINREGKIVEAKYAVIMEERTRRGLKEAKLTPKSIKNLA